MTQIEDMTKANEEIIEHMVAHCIACRVDPRSLKNFCFKNCAPFAERFPGCRFCYAILEEEYVEAERRLPIRREELKRAAEKKLEKEGTERKTSGDVEDQRYFRRQTK